MICLLVPGFSRILIHFVFPVVLISMLGGSKVFDQTQPLNAGEKKELVSGNTIPGINKRIPWSGSQIQGSPEPPPPFRLDRAFPGLTFRNPLHLTMAPGLNRFFVCEQGGKVFSFSVEETVAKSELAIDLPIELTGYDKSKSSGVGDLYALVFHPQFEKNRFCYICYVLNSKTSDPLKDGSRISRFSMSDTNPPRIDPKSEKVMITWLGGGHNGCDLHFGPDGYLYFSTGDAASPNPPDSLNTGQDISDLLSSILRIDVDREENGRPYAIPTDNPFINTPKARPEVWAYGFRNPWRMSFDRKTGDLWVGDVGWEQWEMIYRVRKGGNYGWPIMEGPQSVRPDCPIGPTPITAPALALPHTESASITGGFVYRGKKFPELEGVYIFGDWVSGKVWGTRFDGEKIVSHRELAQSTERIVSFGEDHEKEIFLVSHSENGFIYKLVPNEALRNPGPPFPLKLSQTGLFRSVKDHDLAPGVIGFSINAEMWADHAEAIRFVGLPGTGTARMFDRAPPWPNNSGEVQFPLNGVLGKTLSVEMERGNPRSRRRIETQILHWDGVAWKGYTYAWNDDQSDGILVSTKGTEKALSIQLGKGSDKKENQTWHYPSRTECMTCHNSWAGYTLAFHPAQLNKTHQVGGVFADQLKSLEELKVVQFLELGANGAAHKPRAIPNDRLPNPHDLSQKIEDRARAYLHVNCSHCHQFGAGGTALIDLRFKNKLDETKLVGARPVQGTFEIPEAQILFPGDPYRSVLYYRLAKTGPGRMPHIGSDLIDASGLKLVHDWITGNGRDPKAMNRVESLVKESDPVKKAEALKTLLTNPGDALVLMAAMDAGRVPNDLRIEILSAVTEKNNPGVRDLFERFQPEERRIKRLGNQIRPEEILARHGNVQKGRELFFAKTQSQCSSCHRVKGEGFAVGPDMDDIGKKYTRAQVLESLLDPSRVIDPKYAAQLVETKNGKLFTGLLVSKSEKELVIKTATNQEVRIPAGEIASMVPQKKSLMPEQMLRDLTLEQAVDLLEFLVSLK